MSTEKKKSKPVLKASERIRQLQIPLMFKESRLDGYFLGKSKGIHPKIGELLKQLHGFSGLFDPEKFKVIYGREIVGAITPKMISDSINRFKREGSPDWVVLDEQGQLGFNPELTQYFKEELASWVPLTQENRKYHTRVTLTHLCQLVNLHFGFKTCEETLKQVESIDYEAHTKQLEAYFPTILASIHYVKTRLQDISTSEFKISQDLSGYLKEIEHFDHTIGNYADYLNTIRDLDKRFEGIGMRLEVDLKPFEEVKNSILNDFKVINLQSAHLNQSADDLKGYDRAWKKLYAQHRLEIHSNLSSIDARYGKLIQHEKLLQFFHKLNDPETQIKKELKEQRNRLNTRIRNIQWAKRSVDDKIETLSSCKTLFEKLSRQTDDISTVEMDRAYLDQDAFHFNIQTLERISIPYESFLSGEFDRLDQQLKAAFPQALPEVKAQFERVQTKLEMVRRYLNVLNNPETSASQKIRSIKQHFKTDEEILKKDTRNELNKESKHFVSLLKKELLEASDKRKSNPNLEAFELTYRELKIVSDPNLKLELRQKALRLLKNHMESLGIERQTEYYKEMVAHSDSLNDARTFGWYCQSKLIKPKEELISRFYDHLVANERLLRIQQIQKRFKSVESVLVKIPVQDRENTQFLITSLEKERVEVEQFKKSIPDELKNFELEKEFARLNQLLDLTDSLLKIRSKILLASTQQETFPIQDLIRIHQTIRGLSDTIEHCDKPWGEMLVEPLSREIVDVLLRVSKKLTQQFELIDKVIPVQQFEPVKKEILKRSSRFQPEHPLELNDPFESIQTVKHLLNFKVGNPLRNAWVALSDHVKVDTSSVDSFHEMDLAKLKCLELLFKVEQSLKDIALFDDVLGSNIEILKQGLLAAIDAIETEYNDFVERAGEKESDHLVTFTQAQIHTINALYKSQIDEQLEKVKSDHELPAPKDFLDWLRQAFVSVRQSIFGKTKQEKEKEAKFQKEIHQLEKVKDTQNGLSFCFFNKDLKQEGRPEQLIEVKEDKPSQTLLKPSI